MAEQADGFLSRWARRKQEVRQAEEEQDRRERSATEPSEKIEDNDGSTLAEVDAGLQPAEEPAEPIPDIDSLTRESDFRRFLKPDVPEAVRRQALRKLWRLNPVFANLDGLNDYDKDYSQIGKSPIGTLRSLYRVGRGMISTEEASAEEASAEAAEGQPAGEPPSDERRVEPESEAEGDAVAEGVGEEAAAVPAPAAEEPTWPSVEPRSKEEGSLAILQIDEPRAPEAAELPAPARRRWAGFRVGEPDDSGIS